MPKKKRTRKQKIQADQKRQVSYHKTSEPSSQKAPSPSIPTNAPAEESQPVSFSLPTSLNNTPSTNTKLHTTSEVTNVITTSEYTYLRKDLVKTALLTGTIVFVELLIKLLFKV